MSGDMGLHAQGTVSSISVGARWLSSWQLSYKQVNGPEITTIEIKQRGLQQRGILITALLVATALVLIAEKNAWLTLPLHNGPLLAQPPSLISFSSK